ncbi:MAG: hypothetical protein FJ265_14525 [Planctomycetes bacterium]|nr:hypothetical protein [Planctomycetota bacterium]
MAKNKDRRRAPAAGPAPLPAWLVDYLPRHFARLGLACLADYEAWCRRHGFRPRVRKTVPELERELQFHWDLQRAGTLPAGSRQRNPAEAVRRLLAGGAALEEGYRAVAEALRDPAVPAPRRALHAAVLERLATVMPDSLLPGGAGLTVAAHVAEHQAAALRPAAAWSRRTHNEERALVSLVEHLFARYPAPPFLHAAWLATDDRAPRHRRWYLHVVQGNNLRTAPDLPLALSKRMAHECQFAPARLSVLQALRYGQVRGLGGGDRLALALAATRLGWDFAHDDFWRTVILFCVRFGLDEPAFVRAVVDFLHEQRHGVRDFLGDDGRIVAAPPVQPHLSMHGRTPASLHKQVDGWHRQLGRGRTDDGRVTWPSSGLQGYCVVTEPNRPGECTWRVRELCSALELRHESARMRHCVYCYAADCLRGRSHIFTMTRVWGEKVETMATIEVRGRAVVQACGFANGRLSAAAQEHLRRWAQQAGLGMW